MLFFFMWINTEKNRRLILSLICKGGTLKLSSSYREKDILQNFEMMAPAQKKWRPHLTWNRLECMINHSLDSAKYILLAHRIKMISDLWNICMYGSRLHSSFDPNGQSRLVSPVQLHFSASWAAKSKCIVFRWGIRKNISKWYVQEK